MSTCDWKLLLFFKEETLKLWGGSFLKEGEETVNFPEEGEETVHINLTFRSEWKPLVFLM